MSMTAEEGTADPMPPIRHILCCTDLFPASEPAWGEARLLARVVGADVLLLNVVPLLVIPAEVYVPPTLSQEWIDAADREAQERLARLRDQSEGPAPVITRVEVGSAAEGILRVTRSTDIDLIVMGTHGRSGLRRWMLGSVAHHVIQAAPCPVLTVGPETPPDKEAPDAA